MEDLIRFFLEINHLKKTERAGWKKEPYNILDPESVADHSHMAAIMGLVLAPKLEADPHRLAVLLLVHDLAESDKDVGDITPEDERFDTKRQLEYGVMEGFTDLVGNTSLLDIWKEAEQMSINTVEAQLVPQIDKLEMLVQALIYEHRYGKSLDEFWENADPVITHPYLREILAELYKRRLVKQED